MLTHLVAKEDRSRRRLLLRIVSFVAASVLLLASSAYSKEVQVMTSGAFTAPLLKVVPAFERKTSIEVSTAFGPSMGNTPDSIPNRMARGERVDVVILASSALDELIRRGKVVAGSRVDLARSSIGMVVRAGAPKPDIGSVEALRRTLLNASSIAYSDSASGVYVSTEMFQRLGIAGQVLGKSKKIEGEPVAAVVARGDAEIGFQQISELLAVSGVTYVGPLPSNVQKTTIFSAGIAVGAKHLDAARALIRFLTSPAAAQAIKSSGLEQALPDRRETKPQKHSGVPVSCEQVEPVIVARVRIQSVGTYLSIESAMLWFGNSILRMEFGADSL